MRCRSCDYPLWNLSARQCPECGNPFAPSEYEFLINSVRFQCPHCSQAYYGTGESGHLVPEEFDCASCNRHVHMDEMVLLPTEGLEEEQTETDRMPWLDRHRAGITRSWFRTVGMAMVAPARLLRLTPVESSVGHALWFSLITQLITALLASTPMIAFAIIGILSAGGGFGPMVGVAIGSVLTYLIVWVIGMLLWAVCSHFILLISGGSEHGIGMSVKAIAYSSGANIVTGVPCLGIYFLWIWWVVSAILAFGAAHRVSGARATLCVLIPPLVLVLAAISGWALLIAASGPGTISATAGPQGLVISAEDDQNHLQIVSESLRQRSRDLGFRETPEHASVLALEGYLEASDFIATSSDTLMTDVAVGSLTLETFDGALPTNKDRAVLAAAAALPADVIAHRVGDFVFTHHGFDVTAPPDPHLWIVIASPDPDVAGPPDPVTSAPVHVATTRGRIVTFAFLEPALTEQNTLRAAHGLAPLPAPATITHGAPARGG